MPVPLATAIACRVTEWLGVRDVFGTRRFTRAAHAPSLPIVSETPIVPEFSVRG